MGVAGQLVPQRDLRAAYQARRGEIDEAIAGVLERGSFVLGPEVASLESEFAAYIGTDSAVGVASGTDAIRLALLACGVGDGDAVFTVSHTAVATVAAIELAGATPVFIDIDDHTYAMDPEALEAAIRSARGRPDLGRLRAVVVVHLYGYPAPLPELADIASRHGLRLVEDCAQSHGACLQGRKTGAWGDAAAFSFYPTKNLGGFGDGGMVVTRHADVAEHVRLLRQYGWRERFVSEIPGTNSRLDELQAAVLRVRLRHLDEDNHARRRIAARYDEALQDTGLGLPPGPETDASPVYHQYVVGSRDRDALRRHLHGMGIGTAIHYPVPVHLQPAYRNRAQIESLIRTEEAAARVLSLPIYPELRRDQLDLVIDAVRRWKDSNHR